MAFNSHAQKVSEKDLLGEWIITKGWFGKDSIMLERLNSKKQKTWIGTLVFEKSNKLTKGLYSPDGRGRCGVGLLHFNIASWKLNNKEVFFDIEGERQKAGEFQYKMSYSIIAVNKNNIIFAKKNIMLFEEKHFHEGSIIYDKQHNF